MAKIVSMGEVLIDFIPFEADGEENLTQYNAGGSPANVAVQASVLGGDSAFIGKAGDDSFGRFLKKTLSDKGVDIKGFAVDKVADTTLAFVHRDENGKREFDFYRNPGADTQLAISDIDFKQIDECDIFHFGSVSLTSEPSRTTVVRAAEYAKSKGKTVTYDPNYREHLWSSEEDAIAAMKSVLQYVDIMKLSEDEMKMLTDCDKLLQGIAMLLKIGMKVVIITQGPRGCIVASRNGIEYLPTYDVEVVDTLGAGDSFFGAFLYKLSESGKNIADVSLSELMQFADFANAAGALTASKRGGIVAMPDKAAVEDCIENVKKLR